MKLNLFYVFFFSAEKLYIYRIFYSTYFRTTFDTPMYVKQSIIPQLENLLERGNRKKLERIRDFKREKKI